MSRNNRDAGIARRQFEMIESWEVDHDTAMKCYELEDMIATGSFLHGGLESAYETMSRFVYRGIVPLPHELAEACRELHKAWLDRAVLFVPFLADYEAAFGGVRGAGEFRAQIARVQHLLQNWTVPIASTTPGVVPWDVTPQEAAQLHDLVSAPPGSPGVLARELRPMPSGDSSLIR